MSENQVLPFDHPRFGTWVATARAVQLVSQVLTRGLAELDIKVPHLDILINLYRFEGLTQQELARKLLVGRSNMSMLLPQMEKRGLVERRSDATDRRVLRLHLTEAGNDIALRGMAIQTDIINAVFAIVPIEECTRIGEHMDNVVAALLGMERMPGPMPVD